MKKRNRLETLLFESSILDIDFSKLNQYIKIKILANWDKFNEDIFPIYEVKEIKLEKIHEFKLSSVNQYLAMTENTAIDRGINVINASFSKNKSGMEVNLILEFDYGIHIICENIEVIDWLGKKHVIFSTAAQRRSFGLKTAETYPAAAGCGKL